MEYRFEELRLGESWLINWDLRVLTSHTVMNVFVAAIVKEEDLISDRASRMDRPLFGERCSSSSPWCFIRSMNLKMDISTMSIIMCSSMPNIDYFITATDLQKEVLEQTLA